MAFHAVSSVIDSCTQTELGTKQENINFAAQRAASFSIMSSAIGKPRANALPWGVHGAYAHVCTNVKALGRFEDANADSLQCVMEHALQSRRRGQVQTKWKDQTQQLRRMHAGCVDVTNSGGPDAVAQTPKIW